jgi:hypothetical protein
LLSRRLFGRRSLYPSLGKDETPMARRKKSSTIISDAANRLAGVKSIDPNLDLGSGLTAQAFSDSINAAQTALENYNMALSTVDEKQNIYLEKERALRDIHERILLAVAARYGKNSNEYEQAGGTRKADRAKTAKKIAPDAPAK